MGVPLFGVEIDELDMVGSVDQIMEWLDEAEADYDEASPSDATATTGIDSGATASSRPSGEKSACRYIVTPNVDHVVMLQGNDELKAAYADAAMVVADGFPLILASRLLGSPLPERVAGSELVPSLFRSLV